MKYVLGLLVLFSLLYSSHGANIIGYWGASPGGHASTLSQLQTAISKAGSVPAPKKSEIGNSNFKYLVSLFGGQNGAAPSISISSAQWAKAMYNSFLELHTSLGVDGIDIDLENVWGGTPDTVECGLRTFFALMHNASSSPFFVSMAPQTTAVTPEVSIYQASSWNSYVPLLDTGVISNVDIVAVQLYNNAVPSNSPDLYAQALINGFQITGCPSCQYGTCKVQIPASKIAFGYPAGNGAAPSGCPGISGGCPYGSALTTLYNGSPTLSGTIGVMTWSVEWDEASNWQFIAAATRINFH